MASGSNGKGKGAKLKAWRQQTTKASKRTPVRA